MRAHPDLPRRKGGGGDDRLCAVLLTLWAGSLWTICGLAAPALFAVFEQSHLAGRAVGMLFRIETWLGVTIALLLLMMPKAVATRLGPLWLIIATAGAPLASELILTPMMTAARQANEMSRFGLLHGISAVLFFSACAGALALVLRFNRPAA